MAGRPTEYERKLEEIERLLNDPDTPFDASKVWALLSDVTSVGTSEPPAMDTIGGEQTPA